MTVGAEIVEQDGRHGRLGPKIGQGGEGTVYALEGRPFVAKIFHQPLGRARADKIRAMAAARTPALDRLTAWPTGLVMAPTGEPIGLAMPKIEGHRDIHQLYSPRSRRAVFPDADWRFLVRVAANVARAFATVHAAGHVIGDINHSGILVSSDARVRLIDCDSFQVTVGGISYPCDVGVPVFTAPELQDQPLTGVERTPNHDAFGLAVMIFLVLFMGRHPYAGRYLGDDEMPIERAILEHRFAYGARRAAFEMEQPPATPPLEIVSPAIAELFERAFEPEAMLGGRPTAAEWVAALTALEAELVQCPVGIAHWHAPDLHECPWCPLEAATGVPLFAPTVSEGTAVLFDFGSFWQQIDALEHPGPAPEIPPPTAKPKLSSVARRALWRRAWQGPVALLVAVVPAGMAFGVELPLIARGLFLVAALFIFIVVRWALRGSLDVTTFMVREHEARKLWQATLAEWEAEAGPRRFDDKRAEIEKLRAWWTEAAGQPQQRIRIESAIRRAFEELQQIANQIQVARSSLLQNAEEVQEVLQQMQFDLKTVSKKR
jgi:DNA-binding helix-hairpin-helix protein with protein kinase domain